MTGPLTILRNTFSKSESTESPSKPEETESKTVLHECAACGSVFIQHSGDRCSQCGSGPLEPQ